MASIGQINPSLFSARGENTNALININLDFSLAKFEAPKEFAGLGQAMSRGRRLDAEDGPLHKTARRLGILFEQLIPSTPKLIKAYGLRASEIIEIPDINPQGKSQHGPFEAYVGADCTSIWAAATSGPAALGAHLLSCMLARAWDVKEATALWVELVTTRQAEIESDFEDSKIVTDSTLIAARQEITRAELAAWDASARSWICRADQAKMADHDQFLLIVKNVAIPFGCSNSTYTGITGAWIKAMSCLESLLTGLPQQVSDRAVLLALSSWHLFPDLVVFSHKTVKVRFRDALLQPQGVITLGLQPMDETADQEIRWSLALSHLCYYGDPIAAKGNEDMSRVSIIRLKIVALGSLLASWEVPQANTLASVEWVRRFGEYVDMAKLTSSRLVDVTWLLALSTAAEHVLSSQNREREFSLDLLNYGRRRAKTFLCAETPDKMQAKGYSGGMKSDVPHLRPYFGLCNPLVLVSLTAALDVDCAIRYLRELSKSLGLQEDEAVICYSQGSSYVEYCTVVPHFSSSVDAQGVITTTEMYARWIQVGKSYLRRESWEEDVDASNPQNCRCFVGNSALDAQELGQTCVHDIFNVRSRMQHLSALGEACQLLRGDTHLELEIDHQSNFASVSGNKEASLSWNLGPWLFQSRADSTQPIRKCTPATRGGQHCSCLYQQTNRLLCGKDQTIPEINFKGCLYFIGERSSKHVSFYLLVRNWPEMGWTFDWGQDRERQASKKVLSPEVGIDFLHNNPINNVRFLDFLDYLTEGEDAIDTAAEDWSDHHCQSGRLLIGEDSLPQGWTRSIKALAIAAEIYKDLPQSTVSLKIVRKPLCEARWIPKSLSFGSCGIDRPKLTTGMSRERAFACIAMFESGELNLDPKELGSVLALCSDDAIYVASLLLSDPFTQGSTGSIQKIIGNFGQAGMTMLVAPQNPRIRPLQDNFTLVRHAPYDFKREDNFRGTSLHLSFTKWKLPLDTGAIGLIDQDVHFIESVISLRDRGEWVADLDILCIEHHPPRRIEFKCSCSSDLRHRDYKEKVALDSWEELLDPPENIGIFRAQGNWAARLAAASILTQRDTHVFGILGQGRLCWKCVHMKCGTKFTPRFLID